MNSKKVNRHVLKAVSFLSEGNPISTTSILHQVRYQMRNLMPVPNIKTAVENSLRNLSGSGVIKKVGSHTYASLPTNSRSRSPGRRLKIANSRKRSRGNRDHESDESLSGDEFERTRKRMRTNNKKMNSRGQSVELPKSRQHYRQYNVNDYAIDNPLSSAETSGVGVGYFSDTSIDQDPYFIESFTSFYFENDNEIRNEGSNLLTNSQNEDEINQNSQMQVVELYFNSKSITQSDNAINNSVDPSTENVNSPSVNPETSNLLVDTNSNKSNLTINLQNDDEMQSISQIQDIKANTCAKLSSKTVNSPSVISEKSNLAKDSTSKNSNIYSNQQKEDTTNVIINSQNEDETPNISQIQDGNENICAILSSKTLNSPSVTSEKSNLVKDTTSKNSNICSHLQKEDTIEKSSQIQPENSENPSSKTEAAKKDFKLEYNNFLN